jgi:hypothetical protein
VRFLSWEGQGSAQKGTKKRNQQKNFIHHIHSFFTLWLWKKEQASIVTKAGRFVNYFLILSKNFLEKLAKCSAEEGSGRLLFIGKFEHQLMPNAGLAELKRF